MPRYHLNIYNDVDTFDEEGREYPDLSEAKAAATRGCREMMAEHIILGRPINLNHSIEIVDGTGKAVAKIPFRERITIVDGHW